MLSSQINISPVILNEIREELTPVSDKQEFLKALMTDRLNHINSSEMKVFTAKLDLIDSKIESPTCDLKELSLLIKDLSKVTHTMCLAHLHLFEVLDKTYSRKPNGNKYYYR